MYSIFLCAAIGLVLGTGGFLLDFWGWLGGLLIAMALFTVTWILLARRLMKRLQPQLEAVRKQAEAGHLDMARQTLEGLLPMGRWVPMLTGQIQAQLGALAFHAGDEKKAIAHLSCASRRAAEGQLMLACLHYRNKDVEKAFAVLAAASPFNRKHAMFQNVYAYLLEKEGRTDDAIAQLNAFLHKSPGNAIAQGNVLRLQNRQRMDLKQFGAEWYALGLERPHASMGQLRTARKGFRQPKKNRSK